MSVLRAPDELRVAPCGGNSGARFGRGPGMAGSEALSALAQPRFRSLNEAEQQLLEHVVRETALDLAAGDGAEEFDPKYADR